MDNYAATGKNVQYVQEHPTCPAQKSEAGRCRDLEVALLAGKAGFTELAELEAYYINKSNRAQQLKILEIIAQRANSAAHKLMPWRIF